MDDLNGIIDPEREQAELMLRLVRVMDDPSRKDGTWSKNEQHLAMRMLKLFADNGLELRSADNPALMFRAATLLLTDMAEAAGSPALTEVIKNLASTLGTVITEQIMGGHTMTADCPACKAEEERNGR